MRMRIRDGHADAGRMPIRKMRRYYRTISDICRIMRISASMRIRKYIRVANPIPNLYILHPNTKYWTFMANICKDINC